MGRRKKLILSILQGTSDRNIPFDALRELLIYLGFAERIKGSHHIFTRDDIIEILNIQPLRSNAKTYQVKQIRNVFLKYKIGDIDDDEI